ncbi:unnamed protein product [Sphagnum jensenii]|uniref:Uncharacterized protein n=1 Tax=Sphagnum jensenii TaxID=128206 RepID=A0ABP0W9Q0_9BRYO
MWNLELEMWPQGFCEWPSAHDSSHNLITYLAQWVSLFFRDQCTRNLFTLLVHFLFLLPMLAIVFHIRLALKKKAEFQNHNNSRFSSNSRRYVPLQFRAAQVLTVAVCLVHLGVGSWLYYYNTAGGQPSLQAYFFFFSRSVVWMVFASVLMFESKLGSKEHWVILRLWWIVTFLLSAVSFASAVQTVMTKWPHLARWQHADIVVAFVTFPVTVFLFILALVRSTGILTDNEHDSQNNNGFLDPLLSQQDSGVTGYATAGLLSKAVWLWLNPLLKLGQSHPLEPVDIPLLAPDERSLSVYTQLRSKWLQQDEPRSLWRALVHTFWLPFTFLGVIAMVKSVVMYAGPSLIQRFTDFTAGIRSYKYEGYVLVGVLLVAKVVEVLCSHQFLFLGQKLGILIRTSLVATVYRKGLRLSSAGRQTHGVGNIVSYMSTDVQQIGDSIYLLHNVWVLPLQILIAMGLLFQALGLAAIAGFGVMVLIVSCNLFVVRKQRFSFSQVVKSRDQRMKATNEVLNNMKIIKLQAWDEKFQKRVEEARSVEKGWASMFIYISGLNLCSLWLAPIAATIATFILRIYLNGDLSPGSVFTAVATFRLLQDPMRLFPQALMSISQALVSVDRLNRFMQSDELQEDAVERVAAGAEVAVCVESGAFKWEPDAELPTLRNVDIEIKKGSFVAIVGMVGSGKSTLLASLLGEVPRVAGKVQVSGSIAYVAQTAWIQNGTIQDNILFGRPMDHRQYHETLRVCCLTVDLLQMESGDQTEIGERGINLSGGQKQRIQLARAVYQDADIYLLDDVFSAVDAHTGSELFKECVMGALKGKTTLLVTHQVDFLHGADNILVLRDGEIVQSGRYNELLNAGMDFAMLVDAHNEAMDMIGLDDSDADVDDPQMPLMSQPLNIERRYSRNGSTHKKDPLKLIEAEERAKGRVSLKVYWMYITKVYGGALVLVLVLNQGIWQTLQIAADYWLAYETSDANKASFNAHLFLFVYSSISFGSLLCALVRALTVAFVGVRTAQSFYLKMLQSIFRAPMSFFDTTPTGRIITRSLTDQSAVDIYLPFFLGIVLNLASQTLGILFVTSRVTWQVAIVILPLMYIYITYQQYFMASSRELTRLDSITKAPIIHHFSETIAGIMTVRAFCRQEQFAQGNLDCVDTNARMAFHNAAANEWLGFRLEMIGATVLCTSALFLVILPENVIKPELVGLSLTYGLALNSCLSAVVFLACQVENLMVSAERIGQYSDIPSEAPLVVEGSRTPADWPTTGSVEFRNLEFRYRPNTPLVLKDITFFIRGGEKVGVVGRTGSGKSTLIQALFRLVEADRGSILIDGIDISKLGLHELRSRLSIIPQEPTLFDGTVRSNIDPLGEHTDSEIWESLEGCQLAEVVQETEKKLDSPVDENGENWSVGQRQLFCLGRALLKKSRILVLDEATASVDAQTDAVIQRTIHKQFANCTVISVAHRIPTVMDSNKVLVLDAGLVKEFDSPTRLLEKQSSLFAALVREYTARSATVANL